MSASSSYPFPEGLLPPGRASTPNLESELKPAAALGRFISLIHEIWRGCWQRGTWSSGQVFRISWVFALATLCSWLGIVLSRQSEGVATIWLSNGLIFGLLITQPRRLWLAYMAAGLAADTLADLIYGDPFRLAIGVSLANSVEVVLSCLLLTLWFGSPLDLSRRRTLVGFLLVAVVGATAVTSALGAWWTLLLTAGPPWLQMFRTWYLGDMLGMAILAPLVIMVQRPAFFAMFEHRRLLHTLTVLSVPVVVTALVFTHCSDPLIFFMFPTFLLVAFRLGWPGTVVNILLVTLMAIGFTVKGQGPLMLVAGQHMMLHRIVIAQLFAAVAIFTMFPVAALLEEKESLKRSLARSEAQYRSMAYLDELTRLPNRRAFNLEIERAWEDAFTNRTKLGLVILDADYFKQYNDDVGHLGGDACLRSIAGVIAGKMSEVPGIAARIGGEEFAIILPCATMETVQEIAEAIRLAVEDLGLAHSGSPAGVQTVSVGATVRVPQSNQVPIDLMRWADLALYAAKRGGRNQVVCS